MVAGPRGDGRAWWACVHIVSRRRTKNVWVDFGSRRIARGKLEERGGTIKHLSLEVRNLPRIRQIRSRGAYQRPRPR